MKADQVQPQARHQRRHALHALLFHPIACTREQLHQTRDALLKQARELNTAGSTRLGLAGSATSHLDALFGDTFTSPRSEVVTYSQPARSLSRRQLDAFARGRVTFEDPESSCTRALATGARGPPSLLIVALPVTLPAIAK